MQTTTIKIGGIPTEVIVQDIEIERIFLDQDNPRIGLFRDSQVKPDLSQKDIIFALTQKSPEAYQQLKDSIEINDGILTPIWVTPAEDDKFLVIEGNTRTVIYQELHDRFPHKETWKRIRSYVLPETVDEGQKDFIRLEAHLRGTTPWDAYEKARYLFMLHDDKGYSKPRLEQLTRMGVREIEQFIHAFKLMEEQYLPAYGTHDPTAVQKFSYFVEYCKNKKLQQEMSKHDLASQDFADWVGQGRVPTAQRVRDLRHLLEDENTKELFIQKGYDAAIQHLGIVKPDLVSTFFSDIENVIEGLKNLTNWEISEIQEGKEPGKENALRNLYTTTRKTLELIEGKKIAH